VTNRAELTDSRRNGYCNDKCGLARMHWSGTYGAHGSTIYEVNGGYR